MVKKRKAKANSGKFKNINPKDLKTIIWLDAYEYDDSELPKEGTPLREWLGTVASVGKIIMEDKDCIVLLHEETNKPDEKHFSVIPKSWIIEIK